MTTAIHDASIAVATTLLVELSVVFTIVYARVNRRTENLVYAALCLLFSCILWSARMMQVAADIATAVVWYRIQLSVGALTAATVLDFTIRVSRPPATDDKPRLAWLYGVAALLAVVPWSPLIVVAPKTVPRLYDIDEYARGPLFVPYVGFLLLLTALACWIAWSAWFRYRNTGKPVPRCANGGASKPGEPAQGATRVPVAGTASLISFGANMGWIAASLTAVLIGCTWEFLWALGINAPGEDHINPRAIGACLFAIVAGHMLAQDLTRTLNERRLLLVENQRLTDLAQARLSAVRDTQHEVKNGLSSLRPRLQGAIDSLPEKGAQEARRRLALGMKQFAAVEATLDVMLDVARLEAGQPLSLGRQAATDLPELVRNVCLRHVAAGQHAEAESGAAPESADRFRIESSLQSPRYYVFSTFLDRVLDNLLNNACKYSPPDSPIVICLEDNLTPNPSPKNPHRGRRGEPFNISPLLARNERLGEGPGVRSCAWVKELHGVCLDEMRGPEDGQEWLHIRVTDQGIGIDAQDLETIFERPFYRTDAALRIHGTGAGLNLCRRYIEAQGGRLWAESEGPGRGSTFHLVLPREPEAPDNLNYSTNDGS